MFGISKLNSIAKTVSLGESYWLMTYDGANDENTIAIGNELLNVDSSGNVYFGIYTTTTTNRIGSQDTLIVKLNSSGTFQNVIRINNQGASTSDNVATVTLSGSDVYVASYNTSGSTTSNYVHKLSNNLGLTSTYRLNSSGGATTAGNIRSVWTNGTDLYYAWPNGSSTISGSVGYIAKSNLTGTVSWTRQFSNVNFIETIYNSQFDGTNVYVLTMNSTTNPVVLSYTAAGASSWQRALTGTNVPTQGLNIRTINGLSQMYLAGSRSGGGCGIAKIDSVVGGGTLAWSRYAASGGTFGAIALDAPSSASSNIYQINYISNTSQAITKMDSSGNIVWQRSIAVSGGGTTAYEIRQIYADSNNIYIHITIYSAGVIPCVIKLPSDGTKTGSYTIGSYTITWASTTISYTTPTWTWAAATTFTLSTPTAATQTSVTPSTSTNGLTATTVSIP